MPDNFSFQLGALAGDDSNEWRLTVKMIKTPRLVKFYIKRAAE